MKIENVIEMLEKGKIEKKDYFKTDFALGNYSTQDTSLEKEYLIENGKVYTIVLKDLDYAYITLLSLDDEEIADGYVSYKFYEELIKKINKNND